MPKHGFVHLLQTEAAEDACHQVSHALDDHPRGKSHPQQKKHSASIQFLEVVVRDHFVCLTVSCALYDFVNATVDFFHIEFFVGQVGNSHRHASSRNFRGPGRARFQRHCEFADCDPVVSVNCFNRNATTAPAIFFLPPSQLPCTAFQSSVFFICLTSALQSPDLPGDQPPGCALGECASHDRRFRPLDAPFSSSTTNAVFSESSQFVPETCIPSRSVHHSCLHTCVLSNFQRVWKYDLDAFLSLFLFAFAPIFGLCITECSTLDIETLPSGTSFLSYAAVRSNLVPHATSIL